jgi:chloramphenicol-sensitive protein RarD
MSDARKNDRSQQRSGIIAALSAFVFWGFVPVYFKTLVAVDALEVIAHRIIWAIPMLALFLWFRDGRAFLTRLRLPARTVAGLALSGTLVALNWLTFVWAVNNDQVMATSLGYFITPLVNVLLGLVVLKERLSAVQTTSVLIAAAGTIYLGWFLGTPPWVSLMLAFSFGAYGLVRKSLAAGPMVGLLWEAGLLLAPALIYLCWRYVAGGLSFATGAISLDLLLIGSGLVTILPLIWFNVAAKKLPLSVLGFFQYTAPTISFLLAVFLYQEAFTRGHAVAFSCIWLALALISLEQAQKIRKQRMPT